MPPKNFNKWKKNSLLPKNDVRNIKMSDYRNFNISAEVFMHWSFLCKPNIIIVFFWMNNLLILIMSGTGNSIAEVITNRKLLASHADILLMHKIKCLNEVLINWQIFLHYIQQLCSKFCPSKNFVRGYCIFIKITSRWQSVLKYVLQTYWSMEVSDTCTLH